MTVTSEFNPENIGLYTGIGADSKDWVLSKYQAAKGDKVTVSPSKAKLEAGYKVKSITVSYEGTTTIIAPDNAYAMHGSSSLFSGNNAVGLRLGISF